MGIRSGRFTFGALFGLGDLPVRTQRALAIAFSTSVAMIAGSQLVYPVLPAMMRQLSVGESAIGLVLTAYTVPMIFTAPVAGAIADLRGRRPVLFGGLTLFGLAGAAVGLAPNFEWVLILRALQGIGAAAITPLSIVLLSDFLSGEQETGAQGTKAVLDRAALFVLPVVAGSLAVVAWHLPFFLFLVAVPVALLGISWLPETRVREHAGILAYLGSFRGIGRHPRLLVAFCAGSLRFFVDFGYFTYLPIYLATARGLSPSMIGLLFACYAAGGVLTASQARRIVRQRDPAHLVFLGFLLSGGSVLAIPFLVGPALVGASLFVYGLGNGLISPMQKSVLTRNAPPDLRAGVISLDSLLQQVAKSASPAAMGLLLVFADVTAVFWTLGGISLTSVAVAALLFVGGRERIRRPAVA